MSVSSAVFSVNRLSACCGILSSASMKQHQSPFDLLSTPIGESRYYGTIFMA